jgi:hypothetical protein
MTRVVEKACAGFGEALTWNKVITKELAGATRLMHLSKSLGRPAPVPSIFINGELYYETTPQVEELRACLEQMLENSRS